MNQRSTFEGIGNNGENVGLAQPKDSHKKGHVETGSGKKPAQHRPTHRRNKSDDKPLAVKSISQVSSPVKSGKRRPLTNNVDAVKDPRQTFDCINDRLERLRRQSTRKLNRGDHHHSPTSRKSKSHHTRLQSPAPSGCAHEAVDSWGVWLDKQGRIAQVAKPPLEPSSSSDGFLPAKPSFTMGSISFEREAFGAPNQVFEPFEEDMIPTSSSGSALSPKRGSNLSSIEERANESWPRPCVSAQVNRSKRVFRGMLTDSSGASWLVDGRGNKLKECSEEDSATHKNTLQVQSQSTEIPVKPMPRYKLSQAKVTANSLPKEHVSPSRKVTSSLSGPRNVFHEDEIYKSEPLKAKKNPRIKAIPPPPTPISPIRRRGKSASPPSLAGLSPSKSTPRARSKSPGQPKLPRRPRSPVPRHQEDRVKLPLEQGVKSPVPQADWAIPNSPMERARAPQPSAIDLKPSANPKSPTPAERARATRSPPADTKAKAPPAQQEEKARKARSPKRGRQKQAPQGTKSSVEEKPRPPFRFASAANPKPPKPAQPPGRRLVPNLLLRNRLQTHRALNNSTKSFGSSDDSTITAEASVTSLHKGPIAATQLRMPETDGGSMRVLEVEF